MPSLCISISLYSTPLQSHSLNLHCFPKTSLNFLMKTVFITLYIFAIYSLTTSAQTQAVQRNVWARAYTKDKVFFSKDYFLVEDTCAEVVRFGAFNPWTKKFTGPFKDISSVNPEGVIAEGSYDDNGLKEGDFKSYYPNGNMEAKGNFTNNVYSGRWDFYYPTGKPKLSFVATGTGIKILDVWNEDGKKIVDNGAGPYESVIGPIVWSGKLVGGIPDGKWTVGTMYARNNILGTERFRLGQFVKGSNVMGEYTDSSHLLLASPDLLHLTKAEKMWMSNVPCHGTRQAITIYAQPPNGTEQFSNWVAERLGPVLNSSQLNSINEPIELKGKVQEDGRIIFKNTEGNDRRLVSALTTGLNGLGNFTPARADGKIVQQDIIIIIKYNSSVYTFTYRLLPVGL
ncbi:MAG: hypothetical protein JWQ09_2301 [Segetibacter sp.]|nr:hypothetical protein [Segetibacter sp.]